VIVFLFFHSLNLFHYLFSICRWPNYTAIFRFTPNMWHTDSTRALFFLLRNFFRCFPSMCSLIHRPALVTTHPQVYYFIATFYLCSLWCFMIQNLLPLILTCHLLKFPLIKFPDIFLGLFVNLVQIFLHCFFIFLYPYFYTIPGIICIASHYASHYFCQYRRSLWIVLLLALCTGVLPISHCVLPTFLHLLSL